MPVLDMRDKLTVFRGLDNPNRWQGPFRGSPNQWKASDGEAIVQALREAQAHPVERPLGRLGRRAGKVGAQPPLTVGDVVIPEAELMAILTRALQTPDSPGPGDGFLTLYSLSARNGSPRHEDLKAETARLQLEQFGGQMGNPAYAT